MNKVSVSEDIVFSSFEGLRFTDTQSQNHRVGMQEKLKLSGEERGEVMWSKHSIYMPADGLL